MRQERTVQATIFEVFARHEIGCALQAISQWLDGQRPLVSLVADDLRRQADNFIELGELTDSIARTHHPRATPADPDADLAESA